MINLNILDEDEDLPMLYLKRSLYSLILSAGGEVRIPINMLHKIDYSNASIELIHDMASGDIILKAIHRN